jgi:hypothetical protein
MVPTSDSINSMAQDQSQLFRSSSLGLHDSGNVKQNMNSQILCASQPSSADPSMNQQYMTDWEMSPTKNAQTAFFDESLNLVLAPL